MAGVEETAAENNEQQNFSLPDSDQHDLTVDEFDQQNIAGLHNEYSFPENVSENQSLDGHDQHFTGFAPENNNEIEQISAEKDNEQTLDGEQPDEGGEGIELKQEVPENEANEMDNEANEMDNEANEMDNEENEMDNKANEMNKAPDDENTEEDGNNLVSGAEEKKWPGWPGESVFRMLVPGQKVGNIMGRKGEYIKKMVEETRARIKVLDGPHGTKERAVMVSAKEEPDASLPPAMDGLLRVHSRIVDGLDGDSSQLPPVGTKVSTKLLVPATQAGSLIGKQGATVKSIQETSSCIVRVLGQDDLPRFALADDRVVEVVGEPENVHKAVELIASHLRKFLVDRGVIGVLEKQMQSSQSGQWNSPQGLPPQGIHGHGYGPDPHFMPFPQRQHENYYAPVSMPSQLDRQLHQGISAYGREPPVATSLPSNPLSMAPQVTQHMQVPLQYADSVIGANGSTISYIRRASGATVTIQETRGVPGEMTVEINGTASQVQAAQQLVQNFMADAAAAIAATAATQTGGAADQQVYSQGYSAYAAAAPPGTAYGSAPSTVGPPAQPGAYGSVYGGNYGY